MGSSRLFSWSKNPFPTARRFSLIPAVSFNISSILQSGGVQPVIKNRHLREAAVYGKAILGDQPLIKRPPIGSSSLSDTVGH